MSVKHPRNYLTQAQLQSAMQRVAVNLQFSCGCKFRTDSFVEAIQHARTAKHFVHIAGGIG